MSVTITIPEELYEKAAAIANAQNASVDQVFASAFVEHMAAWDGFSDARHSTIGKTLSRAWQGIRCGSRIRKTGFECEDQLRIGRVSLWEERLNGLGEITFEV